MELEIVYLSPDELTPYDGNARRHAPDDIEQIKESIAADGFNDPIGIWGEDNVIVEGHGRQIAAKEMGLKLVPCIRLDHLTDTQRRDYAIRHNRTTELSNWDFAKLEEELAQLEIEGVDLSGLKFDLDALNGGGNPEINIVEDEPPEPPETPIAKFGDIWQLGRHRLMCGDSTDAETVEKLLDGRKADIVFTDPPYLLETEGGCKGQLGKSLRKQGKEIEFISDFNPANFLHVLPSVFNGNMNAYIFCNKELLPDYLNFAKDKRYSWNVLVWKKPNGIPIGDSHRPDIEYLILYRKNAIWNNGTSANYSRCLEFSRVQKTEENGNHPTIKPVELIANELVISSNVGSLCVDFFGGSGSTLIACEQLNRTCYMMELDPHYCDVIIQRWENLTGEKAVRLNG
jgi:DNA modification methylase